MLLFDRDARGMTPFMLAVSGRAYPAAITVLEAAQKMAKGISSILFLSSREISFELKMCVCGCKSFECQEQKPRAHWYCKYSTTRSEKEITLKLQGPLTICPVNKF